MKKRVGSLFLAVLMLFSMGILPGMNRSEAASSVYFTSVNDTLCPLNDATSPYWSDGVLYVASMVFSS